MSTFPVGGNRRTRGKPTPFDREFTNSSHRATCDQMLDTALEPVTSVVGGRHVDD